MRWVLSLGLVAMLLAPPPASANDWECFGPDDVWCGSTVRQSQPEMGWKVVNKARLPGVILQTIIDAQHNVPVLRVRVGPVPASETARVILSVRRDPQAPAGWYTFSASPQQHKDDVVELTVPRNGLEALIESAGSAQLYVFVELKSKTTDHRVSHKVKLEGLQQALRFARLGRP